VRTGDERHMSSVAAKTAFVPPGLGRETPLNRAAERLGVVAVQLVEAARSAWDGDRDGAKARTCRALILLGAEFGTARALLPRAAEPHPGNRAHGLIRGGLAPFQARRLVEYIDTHIAERMSLHQLARMAGLSNRHFSRAFKQTFGIPSHAYVIRRRIEVAQSVMLRSQLPLSDIALACGLSDQSHLTRMFRRIIGETPYAWRRAHRDALDHAASGENRANPPMAETAREQAAHLQAQVIQPTSYFPNRSTQ